MAPSALPARYVFCTVRGARYGDLARLKPLASVREPEGLTLVLEQAMADANGLSYDGEFAGILLQVHSSLEAVGLTAAVAGALAEQGISANVIAGYFHDHFMVPASGAPEALAALSRLSEAAGEA